MHKILAVIRREFIERVRTKAFVIGTILGPLFFAAMAIIPGLLLSKQSLGLKVVIVDGLDGEFGARVESALATAKKRSGAAPSEPIYVPRRVVAVDRVAAVVDSLIPQTALADKSRASIDGVLVIDPAFIETGKVRYMGKNVGSLEDMGQLRSLLAPLLITERLRRTGIDPAQAMQATAVGVNLETKKVTDGKLTGESGESTFWLAYAMGLILYIALTLYGAQVMTSVIEEKSNRIVEVLVSSLTPFQMMMGKVLGVCLVCLLQLGVWGGAAYVFSRYQVQILGLVGISAPATGGVSAFFANMKPELVPTFLLFFLLGFILYSSVFAAVGSMCNTIQETQQIQSPIMIFLIAGWFSAFSLVRDPTSNFARFASYIPPLAPFVVPVRASVASVPLVELLLAALSTVLGVLLVVWITARIYRVGILMYGKRASFGDIVRWVRAS